MPRLKLRTPTACLLLMLACRPEPSPWPEPPSVTAVVATVGMTIRVHEFGEGVDEHFIVDETGRVDLSLCGAAEVEGSTAAEVCETLARCLATAVRGPIVEVAFATEGASCHVRGEPVPAEDPLLDDLTAALPGSYFDEQLIGELIDAVVDQHVERVRRTDAHPSVQRLRSRARRLLETLSTLREGPPTGAAARYLAPAVSEAQRDRDAVAQRYGPKHPAHIAADRRLGALQRLRAAAGTAEPDAALAHVLEVERSDGSALPKPPKLACVAVSRAFDRRVDYWRGRRDAASVPDANAARAMLDRLLGAWVAARKHCHTMPTGEAPR